jgi:hypothetical protein
LRSGRWFGGLGDDAHNLGVPPGPHAGVGRPLLAVGVAAVVFAAIGVFLWTRGSGGTDNTVAAATAQAGRGVTAEIVSPARLRAIAAIAGRAIYWAGRRRGTRLEFTQKTDGTTYVRYLTGTANAGAPAANYVVVATYVQPGALTRVKRTARQQGFSTMNLRGGGVAVTKPGRPENMYVAFPGQPYQIEVYTPRPAETRAIVLAGAIQALR